MKPIPFKENDSVRIPGDDNEYIIQKVGEFGVCTIVCGTIKKKLHWSELRFSEVAPKPNVGFCPGCGRSFMKIKENNANNYNGLIIVCEIIRELLRLSDKIKLDYDLTDIGNIIGLAVGKHIVDKNIPGFEKDDFISGFNHGFSIQDGTHYPKHD